MTEAAQTPKILSAMSKAERYIAKQYSYIPIETNFIYFRAHKNGKSFVMNTMKTIFSERKFKMTRKNYFLIS